MLYNNDRVLLPRFITFLTNNAQDLSFVVVLNPHKSSIIF